MACSDDHTTTKGFCDALSAGPNPVDLFGQYQAGGGRAPLDQGIARLGELKAAAPTEVRGAIQTYIDTAERLASVVAPPVTQVGAPTTTTLQIDRAKLEAASRTIVDYARTKCGITLS